ncbi:MAG: helix-turn-helix transcriptional regulator, partial [Verrucomicrobiota bacterium]
DPRPFRWIVEGLLLANEVDRSPEIRSHWMQLANTYLVDLFRRTGTTSESRLWPVWEKVNRNLSHPWNLTKLAEVICVSPNTLRRLCLDENGISPMKRVTLLRLENAKGLLQTTRISVSEISKRVGYSDPFAFSVAFKRAYGCSPRDFRNNFNK